MTYVSLTGTQVMAVLNPLLALINQNKKPEKVELLATGFTLPRAQKIRDFLIGKGKFKNEDVHIQVTSDSLTESKGRLPAHKLIARIISNSDDELGFNLAGGLNFQIAACINVIPIEKSIFYYPESKGIHSIKIRGGKITEHKLLPFPEPLNPIDVLSLQDVSFEIKEKADWDKNPLLQYAVNKCGVNLPCESIGPIQIGNVVFDCVFNTGNELKFLKVMHSSKKGNKENSQKRAEHFLKEARKIIALVKEKKDFGGLYHRSVAILTNHPPIAERAKSEGGGKVTIIYADNSNQDFCKQMRDFFPPIPVIKGLNKITLPIFSNKNLSKEIKEKSREPANSGLYLSLGKDIMPTLIAIFSHQAKRICLLYTPSEPRIIQYKKAILSYEHLLPVKDVCFYPVSLAGDEIINIPEPIEKTVEANITPGTKSQTFFLSLWAKLHSAKIYSIETKQQQLKSISGDEPKDLSAPSPEVFLKLSGEKVKQVLNKKELLNNLNNKELFEGIIKFLKMMEKEKGNISDFPGKKIGLKSEATFSPDGGKAKITFPGNSPIRWSLSQNMWFEELIGFVMLKCGADDVQVRIRTSWSKKTEEYLRRKYDRMPHKTDIDVVARFKARYFVISCKATEKKRLAEVTSEVSAVSSLFGRFAVPLLVFLKYKGEPYKHNRVYVFGYKTFLDADKMRQLLEEAIAEKRTTSRV